MKNVIIILLLRFALMASSNITSPNGYTVKQQDSLNDQEIKRLRIPQQKEEQKQQLNLKLNLNENKNNNFSIQKVDGVSQKEKNNIDQLKNKAQIIKQISQEQANYAKKNQKGNQKSIGVDNGQQNLKQQEKEEQTNTKTNEKKEIKLQQKTSLNSQSKNNNENLNSQKRQENHSDSQSTEKIHEVGLIQKNIFLMVILVSFFIFLAGLLFLSLYYRIYMYSKKAQPFKTPRVLSLFFPQPINYEHEITILCSKYINNNQAPK